MEVSMDTLRTLVVNKSPLIRSTLIDDPFSSLPQVLTRREIPNLSARPELDIDSAQPIRYIRSDQRLGLIVLQMSY
jgi:hypothetical protein